HQIKSRLKRHIGNRMFTFIATKKQYCRRKNNEPMLSFGCHNFDNWYGTCSVFVIKGGKNLHFQQLD
ncbi:hypothetical protein, partial [Desulfonatronum sp. SC1]|uniref:hypothetical protein n=1 Tax=Desulfonatronum sp. SC1 TaxID=2109626 RepID=UPI001E3A6889